MKKKILSLILVLSMLFSNVCSEIVLAYEEKEVQEQDVYYELELNELKEQYEIGEIITLTPVVTRYSNENGELTGTIVDMETVSVHLEYDETVFESISDYQLKRVKAEKASILVTAELQEDGNAYNLEKTVELAEINYEIYLEGLREENGTWIYTDENEYCIELNTEKLQGREDVIVEWLVLDKETGENVEAGWKTDDACIIFNGEQLKSNHFEGKSMIVKANVYLQDVDICLSCETELSVRDTKVSLPEKITDKYRIQETWSYKDTIEVNWECGKYPEGELVEFHIDNVKSSNEKVISISFDETSKEWKLYGKKTGSANVTFYISQGNAEYQVKKKISVFCDHQIKIEDYQVDRILSQAASWLGRNEKEGSHKAIIDIYNAHKPLAIDYKVLYKDAWCATYVSAVAIKTGYTYLLPTECGCQRMINLYMSRGEWRENENCTPKPGWIIFYDWDDNGKGDNKGWSDHVGIVEKVSKGKITVIEGNYSDSVKRRTIAVNGKGIRGYAVPDYGKDIVRATTTKTGKIVQGCAQCDDKTTTTIPAASKISLSASKYTYNGKVKKPEVLVKDSKNKIIDASEYITSGSMAKKEVGKYKIKVQLNGKKYSGTKNLYYTIYPAAPTGLKAVLNGGHDDVKISWKKCTGADGYTVYYKKASASKYTKLTTTKKLYCTKKNLADGTKYNFKVVPYFEQSDDRIESINSKTTSVYTLKKVTGLKVSKSSSGKVKVSWKDISGESGYQISKSLIKTKKKAVTKTSKASVKLKATKKKNYYYRVRAYKKINGKVIYGPWSDPVKYKLK